MDGVDTVDGNDRLYVLALALTPGIGWKLTGRLLERFGTLGAIFSANADELQSVRGIGKQLAANIRGVNLEQSAATLTRCEACDIVVASWRDSFYPLPLHRLDDKPLVLFWKGVLLPVDEQAVAIVGTREPSSDTAQMAQQWSAALAERGWTIISGMARGIDTQAHRGAVSASRRSLAVLGCGVNRMYPPENAALAKQVLANGAVISEVHPDMHVSANGLILRNRLITGLSQATIVMEAGTDSGAVDAARRAHRQGRPVFASDNSAGNRALLAEFAYPLPADADKLIEQLQNLFTSAPSD